MSYCNTLVKKRSWKNYPMKWNLLFYGHRHSHTNFTKSTEETQWQQYIPLTEEILQMLQVTVNIMPIIISLSGIIPKSLHDKRQSAEWLPFCNITRQESSTYNKERSAWHKSASQLNIGKHPEPETIYLENNCKTFTENRTLTLMSCVENYVSVSSYWNDRRIILVQEHVIL